MNKSIKNSAFIIKTKEIRDARWFSNLTTGIIIFYACVLGFETVDTVAKSGAVFFHILDYAITIYFIFEIAVKMIAEEKFVNFFKSGWNLFDFFIVLVTLMPLEHSSFAAIARLMRVFRILRLFNARPRLKTLIEMLINSIPSILDIAILMFIIFYVYAIVGSFLFHDMPSGLWDDFLVSMLTLFRVFTFEYWTDVMYETMEIYPWSWLFYVSFIIISAFVFLNLFVAVIIGEMQKMQDEEMKEELHQDSKKLDLILDEVALLKKLIAKDSKKDL